MCPRHALRLTRPTQPPQGGNTCLHLAAYYWLVHDDGRGRRLEGPPSTSGDVVRMLLNAHADASLRNSSSSQHMYGGDGRRSGAELADHATALIVACENKNEAAAAELLEATKKAGALDLQVTEQT